ncbi:universal stress protein [Plantibacter sp. Mn2098]|uniref:universal stress protein n=1 Tax=Plantibacter sp. Mn2098 TaxID=3395266 RepID=UPI003BD37F18
MATHRPSPVIVGVVPGAPHALLAEAVRFAGIMGAELVWAWVDASRYVVEEIPDGSVHTAPIDPDGADRGDADFPAALFEAISAVADAADVQWSVRVLAGDPARALARLAEVTDAVMIMVGTREATLRATVQEFFGGSVAVHLAHRQHRPVLVVPLAPVPPHESLPWEHS